MKKKIELRKFENIVAQHYIQNGIKETLKEFPNISRDKVKYYKKRYLVFFFF